MCGEPDCGAMRGASVIVPRAGAAIGRAADDGEEHSERQQPEPGDRHDQKALRRLDITLIEFFDTEEFRALEQEIQ